MTFTLGNLIPFNTLKWRSFVTMKSAFPAIAQSTNLSSSGSATMNDDVFEATVFRPNLFPAMLYRRHLLLFQERSGQASREFSANLPPTRCLRRAEAAPTANCSMATKVMRSYSWSLHLIFDKSKGYLSDNQIVFHRLNHSSYQAFALIPTLFAFFTYTYILSLKKQMTHIFLCLALRHRPARCGPAFLSCVSEAAWRLPRDCLRSGRPTNVHKQN